MTPRHPLSAPDVPLHDSVLWGLYATKRGVRAVA